MGGAALVFVIVLLCAVILCVRHKKRSHTFNNNKIVELGSDMNMEVNPSYELLKQDRESHENYQYDHAVHSFQNDKQDNTKMESNPSYGTVQEYNSRADEHDYDVAIQPNPSYSSNVQPTAKISEEEYYVINDQHHSHDEDTSYLKLIGSTTDVANDNVKIEPNPSYGL